MEEKIREFTALRVTMERDKLANDEKSIQKILGTLEQYGISYDCITIHVDQLVFVIRESDYPRLGQCMPLLEESLGRIDISIDRDVILLCIEGRQLTWRGISMIVNCLTMQNVDVKMQRYFKSRDRFIIGIALEEAEKAKQVISEIIDANFQI